MTLICVGIDVSKGKSTVSALSWDGVVLMKPCDILHTASALGGLANSVKQFDGEVRVVMEHTGRYWLPVAKILREAGLFVCAVNPKLVRDFGDNKLRSVKNDKADSRKLCRYGLTYWNDLAPYAPAEATRQKLLEFSRQLDSSGKLLTRLKNSLQAIVDETFPGVRKLLTSPARDDGHIKWVDFVCTFYHCDYVKRMDKDAFLERYRAWCKRKGYKFTSRGATGIYAAAHNQVPTMPFDADAKLLISEIAGQLTSVSAAVEVWRSKIGQLARMLPEYDCVMATFGCGKTTGPQLMAEIGDPTRFAGKKNLVNFAGIAPGDNQSGAYQQKSVPVSKKGSPHLRKTLFLIISAYLKKSPPDEPVFQFLDQKRMEGKPYYVYMTAAANKFLRIYYAKVNAFLNEGSSLQVPSES